MSLYTQLLRLVLPEAIVVGTALIALTADLLLLRRQRTRVRFAAAAALASAGSIAAILRIVLAPEHADVFNGALLINPLTQLIQIVLLILAILILLLSADSTFTEHIGEFVLLILLATTGMMFLVATQDILVLLVSLELLSLSLYVLGAFDKRNPKSSEAALKYFLFGGMSAAFLLFGFSLLYGISNSTNLTQIGVAIRSSALSPLAIVAIVATVIGFGFKVAAAPFHFWVPDVYEAAPIPAAAFIASSSKVASFILFFQVMAIAFAGTEGSAGWLQFRVGWVPVLASVAVLSMVLGNLVAIRQKRLRRLLAYSAVAHAGYMLLAIVAHTPQSLAALVYYVVSYALATLGTFAVIGVVERAADTDHLSAFDGLSRRSPIVSLCLFVFLLSLAGIPPLAGFFGKFYLFVAVIAAAPGSAGLVWLVVLAIAMSAVSLYYYLQVLKRVYVATPAADASGIEQMWLSRAVMILLALAVVVLGCAPHLLLRWLVQAAGA